MSNHVIRVTKPVARKSYECDACIWLQEELSHQDFTISDLRQIVKARRDNWRILPGQQYIKQVQKFEGEVVVFRARPEIDAICHKYNLYPDVW